MNQQKSGRIKKTIAVLMVIFFVISLTAVSASAAYRSGDSRGSDQGAGIAFMITVTGIAFVITVTIAFVTGIMVMTGIAVVAGKAAAGGTTGVTAAAGGTTGADGAMAGVVAGKKQVDE